MIHIILNETSRTGQGKKISGQVQNALNEEGISYCLHTTEYAGHAGKLAKSITKDPGEKRLFVMGGDGTVNEIINGIADFENTLFGYIPTGSGNDLARGLNIKEDAKERLIRLSKSIEIRPMDLGEVKTGDGKSRLFAVSAGIGLDADVCRQALTSNLKKILNKAGLGSMTYSLLTVKSLFTMPVSDGALRYIESEEAEESGESGNETDKKTVHIKKMIFTAAMNHPWEGGGVPMSPDADAFDGLLSVCTVGNVSRFGALVRFPVLLKAKHGGLRQFHLFNAKTLEIKLDKPMVVHADGEYCGVTDKAGFRVADKKLNVLL